MDQPIAIFTSARSDYGPLRGVIREAAKRFEVTLIVGGTHNAPSSGRTIQEIQEDGLLPAERLRIVEFLVDGASPQAQANSLALGQAGVSQIFASKSFKALILLGDRWELFVASLPAILHGIPLIHISGGEITEGVIDDSIRHAHSKLAHLHFAANTQYAANLSRMGEEDWRITVSGECGLDTIHSSEFATREEIESRFGILATKPVVIVTFHPSTLELNLSIEAQIGPVLGALGSLESYQLVMTAPGAEHGSDTIAERIKTFARNHPGRFYVNSLGSRNYLGLLRTASAVVGNSSSGIVEAPSFGIPSVNIGNRQKNRMAAASVIHVPCEEVAITNALRRCLTPEFRTFCSTTVNPYDPHKDGRNSERIVAAIAFALMNYSQQELLTKRFDLNVHELQWDTLLGEFSREK